MRTQPSTVLTLAAVALMTSCAASSSPSPPVPPPPASPASTPAPPPPSSAAPPAASAAPPAVQDSLVRTQLTWVVGAMARTPTEGDITAHFSPMFTASVPPKKIVGVFAAVVRGAPYTLHDITPAKTNGDRALTAMARSAGGPELVIDLALDESGLIQGLSIKPKAPR